jgi:regulatory protein RepA
MNWLRLNVTHVLSQPRPILDYLLPNLLKGTVGMLVGKGGIGKTTFMLQVGTELAIGAPILGGLFPAAEPIRVLMLLAEEMPEVMANRLHDAFASRLPSDLPDQHRTSQVERLLNENLHIYALAGADVSLLCQGEPTDALAKIKVLAKDMDLVIIDPIRRFHDGNENDSGDMTRLVRTIEHALCSSGQTVLISHHVNKVSGANIAGDNQNDSRGSSALTDGVRWQANLSQLSREDASKLGVDELARLSLTQLLVTKANYGPPVLRSVLKRTKDGALEMVADIGIKAKRSANRPLRWGELQHD